MLQLSEAAEKDREVVVVVQQLHCNLPSNLSLSLVFNLHREVAAFVELAEVCVGRVGSSLAGLWFSYFRVVDESDFPRRGQRGWRGLLAPDPLPAPEELGRVRLGQLFRFRESSAVNGCTIQCVLTRCLD